jgi:hypothetical protein
MRAAGSRWLVPRYRGSLQTQRRASERREKEAEAPRTELVTDSDYTGESRTKQVGYLGPHAGHLIYPSGQPDVKADVRADSTSLQRRLGR